MQNANEFTHDKNCYAYPRLSMFHTRLNPSPVDLNDPFDVAVALQFLAERFPNSPITLVATVSSGYNAYQILEIPSGHLDHFIDDSGFDEFDNTQNNFITIENNVYALYTDFTELSANLDSPLDVHAFPH